MDWNDLRVFAAVYRHGGLTGAARQLGISIQTAARRISSLEAALDTPLFIRHARGYLPTLEAQSLITEAERVEAAMARFEARAEADSGDIKGRVRVAAPETLTTHVLLPGLKPLLDRHPDLELDISMGVATVGIARGEADIALRLIPPRQGALTVRRVGAIRYRLYTAPERVGDLRGLRLIGWPDNHDLPARRRLEEAAGRPADIRLNHLEAHRSAIRSGLGAGILPDFLADGLTALPDPAPWDEDLYLVAHDLEQVPRRIRLVYEALVTIIETHQALLTKKD